jgi:cytochrome P450
MSPSAPLALEHDFLTLDASDARFYQEENWAAYLCIHSTDPVYRVDAQFSRPFWNVCKHEYCKQVGMDLDLFSTEYGVHLEDTAFDLKPDESAAAAAQAAASDPLRAALFPPCLVDSATHKRYRAPVNPPFRHERIAGLEGAVRAHIRSVLDTVEPDVEIDFMTAFASRIPLLVTAELLGVSAEHEHDFEHWSRQIIQQSEPGFEPDWPALAAMVQFMRDALADRREHPRDDVISVLAQSGLPEEVVVGWCWLILIAGIETTGGLLGAGLDLLLRHPDQRARVVQDPALIRQTVAEMLRMISPGRYIRRTATADTEIGGHQIAKGDMVAMNFTVANFDPELFEDPLRFDIDRKPSETAAFSYGLHRCLGMSVALLESRIAFEELFARFPDIELCGKTVVRPTTATVVVERVPVVLRG